MNVDSFIQQMLNCQLLKREKGLNVIDLTWREAAQLTEEWQSRTAQCAVKG